MELPLCSEMNMYTVNNGRNQPFCLPSVCGHLQMVADCVQSLNYEFYQKGYYVNVMV